MAKPGVLHKSAGIFDAEEMAAMENAIEAVCAELGIRRNDSASRERVAGHVMRSWASGHRLPLNLVQAGLDSAARFEA